MVAKKDLWCQRRNFDASGRTLLPEENNWCQRKNYGDRGVFLAPGGIMMPEKDF